MGQPQSESSTAAKSARPERRLSYGNRQGDLDFGTRLLAASLQSLLRLRYDFGTILNDDPIDDALARPRRTLQAP
jgi:hypothetical protein